MLDVQFLVAFCKLLKGYQVKMLDLDLSGQHSLSNIIYDSRHGSSSVVMTSSNQETRDYSRL